MKSKACKLLREALKDEAEATPFYNRLAGELKGRDAAKVKRIGKQEHHHKQVVAQLVEKCKRHGGHR